MTNANEAEIPSQIIEATSKVNDALSSLSPGDAQGVLMKIITSRLSQATDQQLTSLEQLLASEKVRRVESQQATAMPPIVPEESTHVSKQIASVQQQLEHKEPVAENPGDHARRLTSHVLHAEFDSFQEYELLADKSPNGFQLRAGRCGRKRTEADDLINATETSYRSPSMEHALADEFGIPRGDNLNEQRLKMGTLLCVAGERDGRFIIQGAGEIHRDSNRRDNTSTFKAVFDDKDSLRDFLGWIESSPNEALKNIFERVMSRYDADGNPVGTVFPGGSTSRKNNPFTSTIRDVRIKDLGLLEEAITPDIPGGGRVAKQVQFRDPVIPLTQDVVAQKTPPIQRRKKRFGIF